MSKLTVPIVKIPKRDYQYHRSYLIAFLQRKRNELTIKERTETFVWVDSPSSWAEQARFLHDSIRKHESWSIETKRTYLNALKQLLRFEAAKAENCQFCYKKLCDSIELVTDTHCRLSNEILLSEKDNRLKNEGRDARWLSWAVICDMQRHLETLSVNDPSSYRLAQADLLLSLYVLQGAPLRLNYCCVRLFPDENEKKILDQYDANYISCNQTEYSLNLQHDKVALSHGPTTFKLAVPICKKIDKLTELFGYRRYLLTDPANQLEPLDHENGQKINTIRLLASIPFANENQPSLLNLCTIRSAFATHFLSSFPTENEVEEMARKMRTSPAMLRIYYQKRLEKRESDTTHATIVDDEL